MLPRSSYIDNERGRESNGERIRRVSFDSPSHPRNTTGTVQLIFANSSAAVKNEGQVEEGRTMSPYRFLLPFNLDRYARHSSPIHDTEGASGDFGKRKTSPMEVNEIISRVWHRFVFHDRGTIINRQIAVSFPWDSCKRNINPGSIAPVPAILIH